MVLNLGSHDSCAVIGVLVCTYDAMPVLLDGLCVHEYLLVDD